MRKRFKVILWVVAVWVLTKVASWSLSKYLDSVATTKNLKIILGYLSVGLSFISGKFGLGFLAGALVFLIWDWPVIGKLIRKFRESKRNTEEDERLAEECEEISKFLYEQASTMERLRNDYFLAGVAEKDNQKAWKEARAAESREEERIRRQIGPKVQSIIVALKDKGIKIDLWGFFLSIHDLATASCFLAELSKSLRDGTYLDREFKASRIGLPPRL